MTTFTDGAPPSVSPEPDDGSGSRGTHEDAHRTETDTTDSSSSWLRDEIQRRVSEGGSAGSGGRHARHGHPAPEAGSYVPRHSVATPGPGAPPPVPVGGQVSPQASELLRRERTAANRPTWSGPPGQSGEGPAAANAPPPAGAAAEPDAAPRAPGPESFADTPAADGPAATPGSRAGGPGVAAAAAMRGAALGRTKAARGTDTPETEEFLPPVPDNSATGTTDPVTETDAAPTTETAPAEPVPAEVSAPPDATSPTERIDAHTTGRGPAPAAGAPFDEARGAADAAVDAAADPAMDDQAPTERHPQLDPRPDGIVLPEQRSDGEAAGTQGSSPDAPDDPASKRVRVVLAERKGVAHPVRTVVDVQEGTGVGALLRTNLIGSQLAVALRFAVGAGLTLGLLPLLFAMVPEIGRIEVLGVRLPWLVLGLLVYPFLWGLGLWHARTAERVEQNFADHVQG